MLRKYILNLYSKIVFTHLVNNEKLMFRKLETYSRKLITLELHLQFNIIYVYIYYIYNYIHIYTIYNYIINILYKYSAYHALMNMCFFAIAGEWIIQSEGISNQVLATLKCAKHKIIWQFCASEDELGKRSEISVVPRSYAISKLLSLWIVESAWMKIKRLK